MCVCVCVCLYDSVIHPRIFLLHKKNKNILAAQRVHQLSEFFALSRLASGSINYPELGGAFHPFSCFCSHPWSTQCDGCAKISGVHRTSGPLRLCLTEQQHEFLGSYNNISLLKLSQTCLAYPPWHRCPTHFFPSHVTTHLVTVFATLIDLQNDILFCVLTLILILVSAAIPVYNAFRSFCQQDVNFSDYFVSQRKAH